MARTREFDPAQALDKAMTVFWAKGYSDTSMDDLVGATGVSRYGIYGTFGNKRELFEKALDKYADSIGKQSFLRLLEPDTSLADIQRVFEERVADMCALEERRGCLVVHTAMQLAPQDPELRGVLLKFMKRWRVPSAVPASIQDTRTSIGTPDRSISSFQCKGPTSAQVCPSPTTSSRNSASTTAAKTSGFASCSASAAANIEPSTSWSTLRVLPPSSGSLRSIMPTTWLHVPMKARADMP